MDVVTQHAGHHSFGLSSSVLNDLKQVFARYPEIEQVVIFGSRAKGTSKNSSDIDLAVISEAMSDQKFTELWNAIDDLPVVFKIDLVHWNRLENLRLKEAIIQQGKRI